MIRLAKLLLGILLYAKAKGSMIYNQILKAIAERLIKSGLSKETVSRDIAEVRGFLSKGKIKEAYDSCYSLCEKYWPYIWTAIVSTVSTSALYAISEYVSSLLDDDLPQASAMVDKVANDPVTNMSYDDIADKFDYRRFITVEGSPAEERALVDQEKLENSVIVETRPMQYSTSDSSQMVQNHYDADLESRRSRYYVEEQKPIHIERMDSVESSVQSTYASQAGYSNSDRVIKPMQSEGSTNYLPRENLRVSSAVLPSSEDGGRRAVCAGSTGLAAAAAEVDRARRRVQRFCTLLGLSRGDAMEFLSLIKTIEMEDFSV